MNKIQYTPLNREKREFRLLILLPRSHDKNQGNTGDTGDQTRIECQLDTASLDDEPEYTALSYTWGKPIFSGKIYVNSQPVDVLESVEIALQHFQREDEALTLWIDALCINQHDTQEKNHQVQQMRNIYENATKVIIWLGPSADDSDLVIDILDHIGQEYHAHGLSGISSNKLMELSKDPENERHLEVKGALEKLIEKLDYLFPDQFPIIPFQKFQRRQWWYRVWVVQELAVARQAVFVCGHKEIEYRNLANADYFIVVYCWTSVIRSGLSHDMLDQEKLNRVNKIQTIQQESNTPNTLMSFRSQYQRDKFDKERTLLSLLTQTYAHIGESAQIQATDERDRIFAILGLATDADELNIRLEYSPTYTIKEVYTDVSKSLLSRGNIDILAFCQHEIPSQKRTNLPSWVVDWSSYLHPVHGEWTHPDRPFDVCPNTVAQVFFGGSSSNHLPENVMEIKGFTVDVVQEIGTAYPYFLKSEEVGSAAAYGLVTDTENFCQKSPRYSTDDALEDPTTATIRTLLGDLEARGVQDIKQQFIPTNTRIKPSETQRQAFKNLKQKFEIQRLQPLVNQMQSGQEPPPSQIELDKLMELFQQFLSLSYDSIMDLSSLWISMTRAINGRRPFLSAAEGYVGIASMNMMPGDVIVVLLGAKLPYILRPLEEEVEVDEEGEEKEKETREVMDEIDEGSTGNINTDNNKTEQKKKKKVKVRIGYQFIGEAYVHGIMDGEFMATDAAKGEPETFELY